MLLPLGAIAPATRTGYGRKGSGIGCHIGNNIGKIIKYNKKNN